MKMTEIRKEEIISLAQEFKNHIIYYFDSLRFGENPENIEPDNINEAFFFQDGKCLHVYREDGVKGIFYREEGEEEFITEKQILGQKCFENGFETLVIKKYVEYDEDGQAFISRVLPAKFI
ncbi:MAG: hypothetical protein GX992_00415 [Clostridium sp.]|nr:hypothetical protein [Clostridium sp.]